MFGRHKPLRRNEWPDASDLGDDDTADWATCPACGEVVYEDVSQCPHCRRWITPRPWGAPRRWYHRGGLWAVRMLLLNWLFWLALALAAALAALWERAT